MSNSQRCNICRKVAVQPLNLRCEHHPCYQCAQALASPDPQAKIEAKYQIICPACSKKTVFYDLRHLILVPQNTEEELFVTDRFIGTKVQPRISSTTRGETEIQQQMTRRGSIHSIANNKMLLEVRCSQHNQPYKYFCADCSENNSSCLACAECAKPHYSSGHRLLTLKQAESRLMNFNIRNKQEMLVKTGQITFMLQSLATNKNKITQHYHRLQQNLMSEYEKVQQALNQNLHHAKSTIQNYLMANLRDLDERLEKLYSHQSILQSLKEIQLKDLETSMKFYQTYQKYTITNQLAQIKIDFDSTKLAALIPRVQGLATIAAEWMQIGVPDLWATKVKTRKPSGLEEQISQRSGRQKQNKRIALCQTNLNFKKTSN